MADLDSLSLSISADSSKAVQALDNLIGKLGKLSSALNISGMDGFTASVYRLSDALNTINGDNLKAASDSLDKLSKASSKLSSIGNGAKQAGNAISQLSKEISNEYNITDANVINQIAKAIDNVYSSANANNLLGAIQNVQGLVQQYGKLEMEMSGVNEEAMEFLRNTTIHLDQNWAKELGDDAKKIRGTLGFLHSVRDGGLEAIQVVEQLNARGANIELGSADNNDALRAIAEFIEQQKHLREEALVSAETVAKSTGNYRIFDDVLIKIAERAGFTAEQLSELATGGGGDRAGAMFEQLANMSEQIQQMGNPFANITEGLNALAAITLSDTLSYVNQIADTTGKLGGKSGQAAGDSLSRIAEGLNRLNEANIPQFGDDLARLAMGLRGLGTKTIVAASTALTGVANGLNALKNVGSVPQIDGLAELGKSLAVFGYKSSTQAIQNIPQLATAFHQLMTTLSKAPKISRDVIDLANAMASLAGNSGKVQPATRKASHGIDLFSKSARHASKTTVSLASAIGKLYASYWAILRLFRLAGNSIKLASDLTEVQNVVDHTFGDLKWQMEDFAKTSVETLGMSELTAKQIGSRFQAMGQNMSVTPQMISATNDFVQKATGGYADVADSVADVSINLTRLAGDMASFYNKDYAEVAEDLESIYTGMVKPMRQYGVDLTEASLKQFALQNGMNANIKTMTQAEKMLLRYQYVLAHTTAAHGDFIRTQDTWANTIKRSQENLKRLQIILGQIGIHTFKPLVAGFNNAMNDILHLAESTLNSLGKIFGWQIEISDVGILDDYADGMESIGDGYGDATDKAKKFKNMLLGIDELNLLPDNSDKDDNGAADALGLAANGLQDSLVNMTPIEQGYESIYDTLYKLGARIAEVQKEWYQGIDWDEAYDKAERFGKNLASFLNGYLADAEMFYEQGRFIANGINTVAHAIYGFFHEFDGKQLGIDMGAELNGITGNLDWGIIKSAAYEMAHDITGTINGFFETANWRDVGHTIAEGINTAVKFVRTFWNEIHWDVIGTAIGDTVTQFFSDLDAIELAHLFKDKIQAILDLANNFLESADFEEIGHKIGQFLSELKLDDYYDDIARLIWNLIKAGFKGLTSVVEEAPLEAALLLAFGSMKFTGFGNSVGGNMAAAASGAFLPKLTATLFTDIGALSKNATLLGKAGLVGTAIATAIITAIEMYKVGEKIGAAIFPEDSMWYTEDAWLEALTHFWDWDDAVKEYKGTLQAHNYGDFGENNWVANSPKAWDFAEMLGVSITDTWGDVRHKIQSGQLYYTDKQIEEFKNYLEKQGVSASELNKFANLLVSARNDYENGFKVWLSENAGIMERESLSIEQAYNKYMKALDATVNAEAERKREALANHPATLYAQSKLAEETEAKIEALANHPITRYAEAKLEEQRSELNKNIDSWARLSDAQLKFANLVEKIPDLVREMTGAESANLFTTGLQNVENINIRLSTAFETIKSKVGELSNQITPDSFGTMFDNIPKAFSKALENSLNVMKEMWAQMAEWINQNAKIEIPSTKIGKAEISGGTIRLKVPKFDVGGSIPNDGSLFIANERGAEVVANMGSRTGVMNTEQMEAAITNGMMKALSAAGMNVNVELNGDASTFFTAMVKENNNAIMRTGASPIRR